MISVLISILLLPFVPIFMYGNLTQEARVSFGAFFNSAEGKEDPSMAKVLGAAKENTDNLKNAQKYNLFPLDKGVDAEFVPRMIEGKKDIVLWAGSSVAIDVESGTILHYDQGRKRTQIASLTKMMTAILVMEKVDNLDEEVSITSESLSVPGTVVGCPTSVLCNANRMYKGEKVKVIDLLKAMLLNSANDAATSLAIHVSGSSEKFVAEMNSKAKELGLKDTNFCTPSGLEIDGIEDQCYSSAYDIARIASHSLQYDLIWDIMRIPEGRFYSTDGKYMHELKNTDILLNEMPHCLGGKTGFTPLAGKSLLLAATDPTSKHKIVAVVLNDENRWSDMKILVDWIFGSYEWK